MSKNLITAEIYIATGCAHCPAVLEGLTQLVKSGSLAKLSVTNITSNPEAALTSGIRSVPYTKLGPFILEGSYSPSELKLWTERAASEEGIGEYITDMLKQGKLERVSNMFRQHPETVLAILPLLASDDTEMQVRIGLDAVLEELDGNENLKLLIPGLSELSTHESPRIRGDILHYLSLTGSSEVLPILESALDDSHPDVKEIAEDGISHLKEVI